MKYALRVVMARCSKDLYQTIVDGLPVKYPLRLAREGGILVVVVVVVVAAVGCSGVCNWVAVVVDGCDGGG